MSSKDFFEQLKAGQEPSLVESIQTIAPGLSLSKILGDIGEELTQQAAAGAHEMASALFRGDAFVMYPRTNQAEEPDHGLPETQQEQSRDGREM